MQKSFLGDFLGFKLPFWFVFPLLFLTLMFGSVGGFLSAQIIGATPADCPEESAVCQQFSLFWEAWDLTRKEFVDAEATDPQLMIEGAINGMLNSLGDEGHTRFLSAKAAKQWKESLSGEFEGIGAYVSVRDGRTIITAPMEGSPAEKAGLRAGDLILKVDGKSTDGWTVDELASRVRGPKGTTVNLTILHLGEEKMLEVRITRAKVEVPNVTWRMLPNQVAFVKLNSFGQRAAEDLENALKTAKSQGAKALLLDLRDNPGGLVQEALGVAGQFLPEGTTVFLEQDRKGTREASKTNREGVALKLPMVVLVNLNTASAAEILSGALQDEGRANVVGVTTIGTGTVLTTYALKDGAQLLLGTTQWLTPKGRLIRKQGITPDVEVALPLGVQALSPAEASKLSAEDLKQSKDEQLLKALSLLEKAAKH